MTSKRTILIFSILIFSLYRGYSLDTLYINNQSDVDKIAKKGKEYSVLKFGEGTFFIPRLVISQPMELIGEGSSSILKPETSDIPVLIRSTHNLKLENLVIDGMKKSAIGIYASKNLYVFSCFIQNFHGSKKMGSRAIRTTDDFSTLVVKNSVIRNIDGYEDGIGGNSIGANRGILSNGNDIRILNTVFENIVGKEDGDAIHLQSKKNRAGHWGNTNAIIESCKFIDFGKRAIKLASSNNVVRNCSFKRSSNAPANTAISIYGDFNSILNNEFDIAVDVAWISFSGAEKNKIQGNKVKMNKSSRLFHVSKTIATTVTNNEFILSRQEKSLTRFSANTEKADFFDLTTSNKIKVIK